MQRTCGNRAVQRFLRGQSALSSRGGAGLSVQREADVPTPPSGVLDVDPDVIRPLHTGDGRATHKEDAVRQLQDLLRKKTGHFIPAGVYDIGTKTTAALYDFKKKNNLLEPGDTPANAKVGSAAGPLTQVGPSPKPEPAKIPEADEIRELHTGDGSQTSVAKPGSTEDRVRKLQDLLRQKTGLYIPPNLYVFGTRTSAALFDFKKKNNLLEPGDTQGNLYVGGAAEALVGRVSPRQSGVSPVPTGEKVQTDEPGKLTDKGEVKQEPRLKENQTSNQEVKVIDVSKALGDRLFSITYEFDVGNTWSVNRRTPLKFTFCDHAVFQLGGKLNMGIKLDKDGMFSVLDSPELDVSVLPAFCGTNPGVTAQVNLLKTMIISKVLEADLIWILGLPDKWTDNLPKGAFTNAFQLKGQWMPFGKDQGPLRNLKIIVFGNLSYTQGVEDKDPTNEKPSWNVGGGLGLAHDFDFGPRF
jgi:hypothetical protein